MFRTRGLFQDVVHSAAMSKSLKIIERMVNQNTYDEIAQDFRYYCLHKAIISEVYGTYVRFCYNTRLAAPCG